MTRFPGATVDRWHDAPDQCLRCGGPWRRVQTGLCCLTCAHELIIGEALEQAHGMDRWPDRPDPDEGKAKRGPRPTRPSKPRVLSGTIKRTQKTPTGDAL